MGKVCEKNKRSNLYFDFSIKGIYYLFIECPENCVISVEGSQYISL